MPTTHEREWQFDVYVTTHELLQQGITRGWRSRVLVWSPTFLDAQLVAIQMGFVLGYCTDAVYIE